MSLLRVGKVGEGEITSGMKIPGQGLEGLVGDDFVPLPGILQGLKL